MSKLSLACDLFRSMFISVIENFSSFLFSFSHFSFVHFCFLSVSEARSFLLYSKYKGRKILAIEFKHLHSKLFQINLVDFTLYIPQNKFKFYSIFCKQDGAFLVWRLSSILVLFHVLQSFFMSSRGRSRYFWTKIYF